MEKHLKTTIAILALMLANQLLGAEGASVEVPVALGFAQGDIIPEADRDAEDARDAVRVATYPGKAGFDHISVVYTEGQGVCKVLATVLVDNANSDSYGTRHKAEADELIERVVKKVDGKQPSDSFDHNVDTLFKDADEWVDALRRGNATYSAYWEDEDAVPFDTIVVRVGFGGATVAFEMANFSACLAEKEAADAAAF